MNLTYGITDFSKRVHVKDLFEKFGELVACWLPPVGRRNGEEFGYVKFKREASAEEAFKACRRGLVDLWGVKLNVEWRTTSTADIQHDHDFDAKGSNLLSSRDLFRAEMMKRGGISKAIKRRRSPSESSDSSDERGRKSKRDDRYRDRDREIRDRDDRRSDRRDDRRDDRGPALAIEDTKPLPLQDEGDRRDKDYDDRGRHDNGHRGRSRSPLRRSRSPRRDRSPPRRSRSRQARSRSPPPRARSPQRSRQPEPARDNPPADNAKQPDPPPGASSYATPALRDTRSPARDQPKDSTGAGGYAFAAPDFAKIFELEKERRRQQR